MCTHSPQFASAKFGQSSIMYLHHPSHTHTHTHTHTHRVATCSGGSCSVTHSNAVLNAPCRGSRCAGSAADSLSLICARNMTGSR